ncbi:MAG: TIGR02221 family CRISPR-associated protein [Stellaceae bacterium]
MDVLVLLGTASSMWDALIERLNPEEGFEDERIELIERVAGGAVDQACLDRLRPLMARALGVECRAVLIDMARSEERQLDLLHRALAAIGRLDPDDELVLDVTHSFRHLAMLGLLATMYYEVAYVCRIGGIYYGAFDMREDRNHPTPVVRLDGLVRIGRWIRALHAYDKDGDPASFIPLLKADDVVQDGTGARSLWRAAYFERTGQVERAQTEAEHFRAQAGRGWRGVSGLFEERLLERLPQEGQSLYARQRALAFLHLDHRDYLRAAILGFEAFVTRLTTEAGMDPASGPARDAAMVRYNANPDPGTRNAADDLRHLRNALAHADDAHGRAAGALPNPDGIAGFLERRLTTLLPSP